MDSLWSLQLSHPDLAAFMGVVLGEMGIERKGRNGKVGNTPIIYIVDRLPR